MTKNVIEEKIKRCKLLYTGDLFDFIVEAKLKNALEKSYKEAVFIKNITKELNINYSDAHPLNEIVILHFASIYEAIIDYIFESYFNDIFKEIQKEAKKKEEKCQFQRENSKSY